MKTILYAVLFVLLVAGRLCADDGTIMVSTEPHGAVVGSARIGFAPSPAVFTNVPAGSHKLMVRSHGYYPEVHVVEVQAGQVSRKHFTLKPSHAVGLRARMLQAVLVDNGEELGRFNTIEEALLEAESGMEIHVTPGVYRESLKFTRDVTLIAEQGEGRTVIKSRGGPAIQCSLGARVSINSMVIEGASLSDPDPLVHVTDGSIHMTDCVLKSSGGMTVLAEHEGTELHLMGCLLEDGRKTGVLLLNGAKAVLSKTVISNMGGNGLEVRDRGMVEARDSVFEDSRRAGLLLHGGAGGTFNGCEVLYNFGPGIEVRNGAHPRFTDTLISEGNGGGVFINVGGEGAFERCTISGNALPGIELAGSGAVTFSDCIVDHAEQAGVLIRDAAQGVMSNVTIRLSQYAGLEFRGGQVQFYKCSIENSFGAGAVVLEEAEGRFLGCRFSGNRLAGLEVRDAGNPVFEDCDFTGNRQSGVLVHLGGRGQFASCRMQMNGAHGAEVRTGGNPGMEDCSITANQYAGVFVHSNGQGSYDGTESSGNGRLDWDMRNSK